MSKKDKSVKQRCIIEINDEKKANSVFKILNLNDNTIVKVIKFNAISKTSEYPDKSWEIQTKSGNKYRFRAENPADNDNWFKLVKDILDPNVKEIQSNFNVIRDEKSESEYSNENDDENIYDVKLVVELTNPNFLKMFSKDSIYVISIEEDAIYLKNKNKPSEIHGFAARYYLIFILFIFDVEL